MKPLSADNRLTAVSRLIAERFGLHYPAKRLQDMHRALTRAAQVAGFANLDEFLDSLLAAPQADWQQDFLVSALTVGETYFYRDAKLFELLAERFVPEVLSRRSSPEASVRIWSAGCCTGEEAYTLAILFDRLRPRYPQLKLELLATDINTDFLRQARAGIYRQWSFRGAPSWLISNYFTVRTGGRFELRPAFRRMVDFAPLNLAKFDYPSFESGTAGRDLILCRHVLMYFSPRQFSRAVRRLAECLVEGGWLILSAAEVAQVDDPSLVPTRFGDTTVFVKHAESRRATRSRSADGDLGSKPSDFDGPHKWGRGDPIVAAASPVRDDVATRASEPVVQLTRPAAPVGSSPEEDLVAAARTQASRGDLALALRSCDSALQRNKMNPLAHYLRGSVLLELGARAEAERTFKRALYLDPDFIAAHMSLGSLARQSARSADARRHWRTALALAGRLNPDVSLPEFDGLTARRLADIICTLVQEDAPPGQPAPAARSNSRRAAPLVPMGAAL